MRQLGRDALTVLEGVSLAVCAVLCGMGVEVRHPVEVGSRLVCLIHHSSSIVQRQVRLIRPKKSKI
jgi:hypothetical protein